MSHIIRKYRGKKWSHVGGDGMRSEEMRINKLPMKPS